MYPFLEISGFKIYMTSLGLVIFLLSFLLLSLFFCKRYKKDFLRLFYSIPWLIVLVYILGAYVYFVLNVGLFPENIEEWKLLLSPYGYKFHFIGIVLGILIWGFLFFIGIKRYDNKKNWIDILFFSTSLSLIPLGFFLLLGDDFLGISTDSVIGVKALTLNSKLTKFSSVYPIGLFLMIGSLLITFFVALFKRKKNKFGLGLIGFILIVILFCIIFLFQQYPRHGVMTMFSLNLDVKHYFSFLLIMFLFGVYMKWKKN